MSTKLIELWGEDEYYKKDKDEFNSSFKGDFMDLIEKYNDPTTFDKLCSAHAKVDLAKEKMAAN